jgi:hypothetical protein
MVASRFELGRCLGEVAKGHHVRSATLLRQLVLSGHPPVLPLQSQIIERSFEGD